MNLCRRCKQDFGSVTAFDAHRVGKHEYVYDLEHEDGRRCLAVDELLDSGWARDQHGRWRTPRSHDARLRLAQLRSRASKSKVRG